MPAIPPKDADEKVLWEVEIAEKRHFCLVEKEGDRVHLTGPQFPLLQLVEGAVNWRFFRNSVSFNLKPISRIDHLSEKTPEETSDEQ